MRSIAKLFLISLSLSAMAVTGSASGVAEKNTASVIVDRHLSGFNSINVGGSFDVMVTQGPSESVKVEAPADVMDRIVTEVSGGELRIYNKHDNWNWGNWWGNHKKIIVYVTAKDLTGISLSGSGDVYFKQGLTANVLKLRVVGSGDITGVVNVKTLESSISGSGDMRLAGHAQNSTVSVSGSGDFRARDLPTAYTAVRISGSGDAYVNAGSKVDASIAGSGDVHYTGGATNISSSKSGSGDVIRF